ncbi:hypothetical protein GOM49_08155 [Clostridium bovifaecis]|uniref:DUF8042 domain-containing protein n=1 Tax=Clostridium bovifaecis TaxID=2184719 RepID=A0A6I6EVU3_9CLOT|nr:hypothetical protein GOM49_08155 [Clostridium bovifaecis]
MNNKIEILNTAQEYINSLKGGIIQTVNYYQNGEESKASDFIIKICDGIEWLAKALTLTHDVINSEEDLNQLNRKLEEIVEAFENEDYILISDLLEYEIMSILDEIQANIKQI